MYQSVIDALIQAREVPASSIANPYTPTQWDLTVLRIEEMIISQPLQKGGLRRHLSELSDEDFLVKLPANLRHEIEHLLDGYSSEHRGMRDAILGAASRYRQAKNQEGDAQRDCLRYAVINHLRALGYQEHIARKIIAATSDRLAVDAVLWMRATFRQELGAHPKISLRGTNTWKKVRKGTKIRLACMLRGIVEEGREDHLSRTLIGYTLKAMGHQLPRIDMRNRETVLGFLEAARLSLVNMPWHLVK